MTDGAVAANDVPEIIGDADVAIPLTYPEGQDYLLSEGQNYLLFGLDGDSAHALSVPPDTEPYIERIEDVTKLARLGRQI